MKIDLSKGKYYLAIGYQLLEFGETLKTKKLQSRKSSIGVNNRDCFSTKILNLTNGSLQVLPVSSCIDIVTVSIELHAKQFVQPQFQHW